ncbi:FAD-dependent oxidoreductase [Mycobacterium sp. MYCO198283]|uniref:NAD(P)/FAD-dependent oxidoreductase n=1 Tax=Mycobacterium sp. MYCO198283 TaxID=2883505 RepID=UPI001E2AEA85|nr:FAD-dependent oxidoreductase [Mycobacterium sp. MYCO198283]MCG5430949.1 FAD-dependent oxidoreductase [Mycobacterium sp. MYCO198283]
MTAQAHVVVLGGGYAGVQAADRLAAHARVTLVNPRPMFVERIRLHQLVAGNHAATAEYESLLAEGVSLVVDSATRIDAPNRTVHVASGREPLHYDYLVYAVGSTRGAATVPGAEYAHPIAEWEYATALRAAIDELHPAAPVTVVGAGLTGIETAAELAEQGRNVTLVCGGRLAPSLSAGARRSTARRLAALGVTVLDDDTVVEVRRDAVVFADGAVRPSAVTIWTAGFGVPALAADSGLRTDALGRLLTDETLTSVDDPHIVAAGDCAAPSDRPLRMSCQAAGPLGAHAAETVIHRLAGTAPDAIAPRFVAQCVSLGRHAATLQFTHMDDSPGRFYLGGRIAAAAKEAICRGTVWGLRREARKPGSGLVVKGARREDLGARAAA